MTTKTERFREIAAKHTDQWGDTSGYLWHETPPGPITVDGHVIEIVESTNFNSTATEQELYAGPDMQHQWVIVEFEGDYYRLKGIYDSWDGGGWEDWQRIESRQVTKTEWVEVDDD